MPDALVRWLDGPAHTAPMIIQRVQPVWSQVTYYATVDKGTAAGMGVGSWEGSPPAAAMSTDQGCMPISRLTLKGRQTAPAALRVIIDAWTPGVAGDLGHGDGGLTCPLHHSEYYTQPLTH